MPSDMPLLTDLRRLRVDPEDNLDLSDRATQIDLPGDPSKEEIEAELDRLRGQIGELQDAMFTRREQALLVVLQGMDSAGKDSTTKAVFTGVNPLGIRAAFHPNPTEPGPLAALVRDYKLTLMAAPPTFLGAVLERAAGTENLASLRCAFVGAEKWRGWPKNL